MPCSGRFSPTARPLPGEAEHKTARLLKFLLQHPIFCTRSVVCGTEKTTYRNAETVPKSAADHTHLTLRQVCLTPMDASCKMWSRVVIQSLERQGRRGCASSAARGRCRIALQRTFVRSAWEMAPPRRGARSGALRALPRPAL